MSSAKPIVIVGAGPAGLTCAIELAEAGVETILIDDNARPGGQIFRTGSLKDYPEKDGRGDMLREELAGYGDHISYRQHCQVIAVHQGRSLWVYDEADGTVENIDAEMVVYAGGATEVAVPVPGWTLPGVYALGGLQGLIKGAGVVPAGRVVLGGAGPLLLLVAAQLVSLGVKVAAVVDAAAGMPPVAQVTGLLRQPGLLARGMKYMWALRKAGVPVYRNSAITHVMGDGKVQSVEIQRLNADWTPRDGDNHIIEADVVGMSFGLQSNVELTVMAGCAHDENPDLGGVHPRRNQDFETTVDNVFAIGDGAGISGVEVALAEGAMVASAILKRLGEKPRGRLVRKVEEGRRTIAADRPFHDAMARWSGVRSGIFTIADADTVVCRCEEVTRAAIGEALEAGLTHPAPLKMRTRAGMGLCQGRTCNTAVRHLIALHQETDVKDVPMPTVRVPLRPVPAHAFAQLSIEPAEES